MVKKTALFLAVLMLLVQTAVFAGDLYSTDVRQVYCFSDLLRTYVDAEDSGSNSINKPERSDVAATIDGNKLTVQDIRRFGDTDEGVADIFLVDISGSIRDSQMKQVKAAIKTWAANMKNNDRIAIITFGENVRCAIDFSNDRGAIDNAVNSITNNDRKTQLYGGISEALKLATRTDANLPKRKNIVLITDGVNDYNGGVSENDVFTQLKDDLVPVYSMLMPNSEKGRATINSVTEYSGGKMYDMSNKQIDTVYGWIRESIQNSYTVDFAYGNAVADDGKHSLNVKIAQGDKIAEDSVQFTFKKSDEPSGAYAMGESKNVTDENKEEKNEENSSDNKKKLILIIGIILFVAVAIVAFILFLVMRGRNTEDIYTSDIYSGGSSQSFNQGYPDHINNGYNNAQSSQGMDRTMNVNEMGQDITIVLSPINGGAQLTAKMNGIVNIGRGPLNEIVINDDLVSGRHCSITNENGVMYIEDMMSTNGTILNGILINSKSEIRNNDTLMLGNNEYRVSFVF
ncbi:MAG: VWA domain-containing protein [Clostridia bacterium]|nr:VWA domain-containing protein [Clostridia bacterium]